MKKHRISKHSYLIKEEFLTPISKLLKSSFEKFCPISAILDMEIMELWSKLMQEQASEKLRDMTLPNRISKDRKLFIGVKSAVVANEVQFMKKIFLEALNRMILDLNVGTGKNYSPIREIVFELRA
jgi:hypothetical protein